MTWKGERHRHALSAKGMKSSKPFGSDVFNKLQILRFTKTIFEERQDEIFEYNKPGQIFYTSEDEFRLKSYNTEGDMVNNNVKHTWDFRSGRGIKVVITALEESNDDSQIFEPKSVYFDVTWGSNPADYLGD